ncbi:hypothetical protein B0I37DRAFT_377753 [Chaetomium sp. MPI-CAGE-AT-0009]|nr:hypothetical protein B0I37DRAFT_377753 [Chaetomium sp. MPI-CAGE-AT-0009]
MANTDILNFGGKNLVELYNTTGSRDAVFAYLDSVIQKYKDVNPPIDEPTKDDLVKIRHQIELLSLPAATGTEYDAGPEMTPNQHIRRQNGPRWPAEGQSKFTVLANGDQSWSFNEGARRYWNQYDLLGLFFSKMGPAPGGEAATQRNFYLPLTAVYAKFCLWIGGNQKPRMVGGSKRQNRVGEGTGDPPYCFQCTWRQDTGRFFLGATLAGYDITEIETGTWGAELKGTRYHLLDGFFNFPGTWGTFEGGQSPTRGNGGHTFFGNCAETYPYLEILGENVSTIDSRDKTHGLALKKQFADVQEYKADAYRKMLMPPCLNCQQLLLYAGIYDVDRFIHDSTMKVQFFPPVMVPKPAEIPEGDQPPEGMSRCGFAHSVKE